ncbi:methyl-accepting chemotaxis protein [Motiliproteus sp.]|uniref:methyl-accepting chemotaxis protein n=1 Tax=Motiliproteus sp. TaxID=1898955 RepID=UPI003BAB8516
MALIADKLESLLRFNRLSVGKKLLGLSLMFVVVLSATVGYTYLTLDAQKSDGLVVNIAGRQRMLTQKFTKEFFVAFQQARVQQQAFDPAPMQRTAQLFELSLDALRDGGTTYLDPAMQKPIELPGTVNAEIRSQLAEVDKLWGQLQQRIGDAVSRSPDSAQLAQIDQLSVDVLTTMNQAVLMLAQQSDSKVQTMLISLLWTWAGALIASLLIAWLLARNITTPLYQVVNSTQRIGSGDLCAYPGESEQRDELGLLIRNVDRMRSMLSDVIHTVQQNSKQMSHSSMQIATISGEVSSISEQEQQSAQQVMHAIDSLQQIAADVSEHIEAAHLNAQQTREVAQQGVGVMQQSISELTSAVDSVGVTAERLGSVKLATDKIHSIIEAIDSLAEQTNLLALNAAIEAARAGEQGRGFAVVADEVRGLATRTADSTTEITTLIHELTTQVEGSVDSMKQVTAQVNRSQQQSEQTLETLASMTADVERNSENSTQIAQLNQSQVEQLTSLHQELNELFDVLTVSTEKAGSISLVAGDLHRVSDELDLLLARFRTDQVSAPTRHADDKRQAPRINNQLEVSLCQAGVAVGGLTQNLSMTGAEIKLLEALNEREPLQVEILLPEEPTSRLSLRAKIMRCTRTDGGQYLYGIRFESLTAAQQQQLSRAFDYFRKAHSYA